MCKQITERNGAAGFLRRLASRFSHWWCDTYHRRATSFVWDCQGDTTDFHCRLCDRDWSVSGGPG